MRRHAQMRAAPAALLVLAGCLAVGCGDWRRPRAQHEPQEFALPVYVRGTVAEFAGLAGGGDLPVQGYGVVVGLGRNGSSEVPPHVAQYLKQYLKKQGLGSSRAGTGALTPERVLRDLDTAVVLLAGAVPPAAPKGTRFDLTVRALPGTQTRSLEGGYLEPAELHLAFRGRAWPGGPSFVWARGRGEVFVNPFRDVRGPENQAEVLSGRIIGGAEVVRQRPVQLQLRVPDYARADLIQRRINERFGTAGRVATAQNAAAINVEIPRAFRDDYTRFLRLLLHLPLDARAATRETMARQIADRIVQPGANADELALVWEAMGRRVLPVVQGLYTSEHAAAAFHAARTGVRLGDRGARHVLLRFAREMGSPLQIPAVRELGRHPRLRQSVPVLRELLEAEDALVRLAAYEALEQLGDGARVRRVRIGDEVVLDLVSCGGRPAVYASQTGRQKIVLFGRDLMVRQEVFFRSADGLVTLFNGHKHHTVTKTDAANRFFVRQLADRERGRGTSLDRFVERLRAANPGVDWSELEPGRRLIIPPRDWLVVFREMPSTGRASPTVWTDFRVESLVKVLARRAGEDLNGEVTGLGLTYGQVVRVLYRLCEEGHIPAKFLLLEPPETRRIYQRGVGEARPVARRAGAEPEAEVSPPATDRP